VSARATSAICWVARIAGIAAIGFLSLFALDVFEPGAPLTPALLSLVIHLIPSLILVAILVAAWRWPLPGGVLLVAVATMPFVLLSNPLWVNAMLAAPFALTGVLFVACHVAGVPRRNGA